MNASIFCLLLLSILVITPYVRADDDDDYKDYHTRITWEGLPTRYGQWYGGQQVSIAININHVSSGWFVKSWNPTDFKLKLYKKAPLTRFWRRSLKELNTQVADSVDKDGFYKISFTVPEDVETSSDYQILVERAKKVWFRSRTVAWSPLMTITSVQDRDQYSTNQNATATGSTSKPIPVEQPKDKLAPAQPVPAQSTPAQPVPAQPAPPSAAPNTPAKPADQAPPAQVPAPAKQSSSWSLW